MAKPSPKTAEGRDGKGRSASPVHQTAPSRPYRVGYFLTPNFTMMAFTSAIEPLRLANQVMERQLYSWRLYSVDGQPVRASNGVEVRVDEPYTQARDLSAAILCAGNGVQALDHRDAITALRRLSSFGTALGAVCTGTYVLAKGGLLNGYQSTIHWENQAALMAEFPDLDVTSELFEIDRNRFTCAGGTAAADMMLSIIGRDHGPALATAVTDQLIHHRAWAWRIPACSAWSPAWKKPSRPPSVAAIWPRKLAFHPANSSACSQNTLATRRPATI
jgi:AraC family transcriptional regulator, glycine betaine-responsive activator